MFLGSRHAVLAMLQKLTESQHVAQPIRIAVAFWGSGAERIVSSGRQYQIICNLVRGGTNPAVIEALRAMPNVHVRHHPELHAKVILADRQAIVGSANFSAGGLGFEESVGPGWLEAAAVIDVAAVNPWFEAHWQASSEVSDETLALAAEVWAARFSQESAEGASDAIGEPVPQLSEAELFKASITGRNMIRMAARPIELIYFQEIEPESKRSVWNPAYASSLRWTTAGNRVATKIDHCPYFEHPSDVLERAKHAKTIEKIHRFVGVLARHPNVSPGVQYWAKQYLRSAA